jgi:hypothetical protein
MEASACSDASITNWVAHFGVPATVTMDRGAQITSALLTEACKSLGIKHVLTTAYHPQSNGMGLSACTGSSKMPCVHMECARCGTFTALGVDGPACRAERGFGCIISRVGHWDTTHTSWPAVSRARSSTCQHAATTSEASILCCSANAPLAHLAQAEHAYVRVGSQQKPLASPYAFPYLVVSKGAKTFTIQVGKRQEVIS